MPPTGPYWVGEAARRYEVRQQDKSDRASGAGASPEPSISGVTTSPHERLDADVGGLSYRRRRSAAPSPGESTEAMRRPVLSNTDPF